MTKERAPSPTRWWTLGMVILGTLMLMGIGATVLFAVDPAMLGHGFHRKERGTAIAFTALKSPESKNPNSRPADWPGALLVTVTLCALVLAIIRGGPDDWTSARIQALFVVAAVGLPAFVAVQVRNGERARIGFGFFLSPEFIGIPLVALFPNALGPPSVFIETDHLENVLHSDAWTAGLRMLPMALALFFFGVPVGRALFQNRLTTAFMASPAGPSLGPAAVQPADSGSLPSTSSPEGRPSRAGGLRHRIPRLDGAVRRVRVRLRGGGKLTTMRSESRRKRIRWSADLMVQDSDDGKDR